MSGYQAPLKDMFFLLNEMRELPKKSLDEPGQVVDETSMILEQAARFAEKELSPINAVCDQQGCRFVDGKVVLPAEFKLAYKRYFEAGWMGVSMPEQWGGQALSNQIGSCVGEMLTSSNHAFCMVAALTMSATRALIRYGSDDLKTAYLPKMVSGEWTGCMALTEPHCGSDLGLIKTSAEKLDEKTYVIKGAKIFISAGDHDASDNIIHLVLARVKDSPKGIKGLSLFLVPSVSAETGEPNKVECIGIEDKMGIHANPTCTISYDNAVGYLVGEVNQGIKAMFAMMNEMRLGTALQGVGLSESSFQKSLEYAKERTQGRQLSGLAEPEKEADSLIHHPDIRRMLLTQKAFAEGGRALCQFCAELLDISEQDSASGYEVDYPSQELLDFLTPIAKAFCTESALEAASNGIQIFGGHGYIRESGVEQLYRDGRIATIYEGTTGIQALDLLGRKVLMKQGKSLLAFTKMLHVFYKSHKNDREFGSLVKTLAEYTNEWPQMTQAIGMKAMKNPDEVGAAAYDYLMYSGYVTLAYFWLRMAVTSRELIEGVRGSKGEKPSNEFLKAKIETAFFYYERLLPRAEAHKAALKSGVKNLGII